MSGLFVFKFLEEISLQCRFASLAYEKLRANVQAWDPERTFLYVHALLNHAGNVSRLLWPVRAESKARGDRLRSELKIADESPLKMGIWRRAVEAPDEDFEDWIGAMETPNYVDFNIMPQGTTQSYRQDVFQRNLDPETFKLVFRGTQCDLREVMGQLRRIESAAQRWLKTHNPW